eukprot:TRINITY_DN2289_c0_g1::TRINITY_DN2289_c0_g1_i1::g.6918::m.6918 TRINITY_DN2289_c0_g1::TRINITY_DN2289_c0_g1_i1::g.6918  ORF type:complete len:205 (+),score=19.88,DUF3275/PF11679.3/1.8e+02,DUF3275/PF11679.3/2.5 TRINITY_DN2289_c0_g1_i1:35-616(+)
MGCCFSTGKDDYTAGGGKPLGGGTGHHPDRDQMAKAAEARANAQASRGVPSQSQKPVISAGSAERLVAQPSPSPAEPMLQASQAQEPVPARASPAPTTASNSELREQAATAALMRTTATPQGITEEKARELAEKRERDDLLGRIRALLQQVGEDEPFGLAAASTPALRRHYERAQRLAGQKSKEGAVTDKVRL